MERRRILKVELIGKESLENFYIECNFIAQFIAVVMVLIHITQVISARSHHIDAAKIKIIYPSAGQRAGALLWHHIDRRWKGKAR